MRLNILLILGILLTACALTLWLNNRTLPVATQPDHIVKADLQTLPHFAFTALDGRTYTDADFKDKIILLNFWASWCAPCVKEFPDLVKIAARHEKNVVLIALSSDMDEAAIRIFLKKSALPANRPNIKIALDSGDTTGKIFGTYRLPETLIIGKNRQIVERLVGATWNERQVDETIEKIK